MIETTGSRHRMQIRIAIWLVILVFVSTCTPLIAGLEQEYSLVDADFDPQRISALVEQLGDASPEQRVDVIRALGELGAEAGPAIDRLISLLADDSSVFRYAVAEALDDTAARALIDTGPGVVEPLMSAFDEQSRRVRRDAPTDRIWHGARVFFVSARCVATHPT